MQQITLYTETSMENILLKGNKLVVSSNMQGMNLDSDGPIWRVFKTTRTFFLGLERKNR